MLSYKGLKLTVSCYEQYMLPTLYFMIRSGCCCEPALAILLWLSWSYFAEIVGGFFLYTI